MTFDLTTVEGRVAWDAWLGANPGVGPEPPFARSMVAGRTGPKRPIEVSGGITVLVPQSLADEVTALRRQMLIPLTRSDARVAKAVVARLS